MDTTIESLAQQFAALQTLLEEFGHQFLGPSSDEHTLLLDVIDRTVAGEALTVTISDTPPNGEVWIISRLTLQGICTVAPPTNAQSPVTGLFLVPYGAPIETLAQGQGAGGGATGEGWNVESRGIALPAGVIVASTTIDQGGGVFHYAFNLSLTQSTPLLISPGQTLRAVVSCNPGTATPGPGAASWGRLIAMGVRHRQAQR